LLTFTERKLILREIDVLEMLETARRGGNATLNQYYTSEDILKKDI